MSLCKLISNILRLANIKWIACRQLLTTCNYVNIRKVWQSAFFFHPFENIFPRNYFYCHPKQRF